MEKTLQKIKEFHNNINKVADELHTTFPKYGFKIKFMSEIFLFTVETENENIETLTTSSYILKYPTGFDIELFKTIIDKY
ncbi:hypothetical protein L5F37_03745 [Aliarcobacter butzleri]|uniref:hypothetical protein n=1 Tax=Aliarcobacter butzleri TaxID=28197 RepID=UPI001EDBB09B|nr:hypothetical protein [Aliarcobacter butzleri]MCG3662507.1 hypothetical protein [Aliarcobacter butzleri]